jgi:thioredoxin 1
MRLVLTPILLLALALSITSCGDKKTSHPAGNALHLSEAKFKSEIRGFKGVAMVDFWAEWCGPCKVLAPAVEELATELKPAVKIGKVDVDENMNLAKEFEISSIPCLILFKDGKEIARTVGAKPKADIKAWIERAAAQ